MSRTTYLRELTDRLREILVKRKRPVSAKILVEKLECTRVELNIAVWSLVDNQEAEFTDDDKVVKTKWLRENTHH